MRRPARRMTSLYRRLRDAVPFRLRVRNDTALLLDERRRVRLEDGGEVVGMRHEELIHHLAHRPYF